MTDDWSDDKALAESVVPEREREQRIIERGLSPAELISRLARAELRDEAAKAEVCELRATFDLRWKADMRAIKMWQAETGEELTWPDHADLCVWLLTRCKRLGKALEFYSDSSKYDPSGPSKWFPLIEDSGATARAALSDTAQQETDSGRFLEPGSVEKGRFDMRERAANAGEGKLIKLLKENYNNPRRLWPGLVKEAIRALPLDPETGGAK